MKKLFFLATTIFIFTGFVFSQTGWYSQTCPSSDDFRSVYFVNAQTGWMGGFANSLIKTTNAGNSWFLQTWYSPQSLMSFYFINDQTGWAAGGVGTSNITRITKTTDGGNTWPTQYYSTTNGMVMKISFVDNNTGWAATLNGRVLKTTNSGVNWLLIYTVNSSSLTCCKFINQLTGWVAGTSGKVLKTTDGGSSFSPPSTITPNDIEGIFFINQTTGFIVGTNGLIMKTTDTGLNWITKQSGNTYWLNGIFFINNNTGWVVGGNYNNSASLIQKTTNGGESWFSQTAPTSNWLADIMFVNETTGWISGRNGTILYTQTAGEPVPSAPTLVSPANGSTNVSTTPTMVWNASSGATRYKIQISTVANFLVITDSATVNGTQYVVPNGKLQAGYTYFWRVNASNSYGTSPWSSVWSFSTTNLPPAPTLISPPNGFIGTSLTPTLVWNILGTTTYVYKIQISRVPNFTFIVDSATRSVSNYTVPPGKLQNNITYFWRVNATNSFGTGPWSDVWSFTPQTNSVNLINSEIPKENKLYNNYPNPFNPVTKIRFDVAKAGYVSIKVYNIQGKEISTLINYNMTAGSYETIFDASALSSGVYYYRIQTEGFVDTKRMVLVK